MKLPTEKHPFPTYLPDNFNFIIVGSFPPIKLTDKITVNIEHLGQQSLYNAYSAARRNSLSKDDILFYYGSRDNLFWKKIIAPIFKIEINNKEDIIKFLNEHNLGITDVCEEISRKIIKGKISSNDEGLIIHKHRDIGQIINRSNVQLIFSTSKWVTDIIKFQQKSWEKQVNIITLLSPSKSSSRTIGRNDEYRGMKYKNLINDTIQYRQMKYIESFKNRIC